MPTFKFESVCSITNKKTTVEFEAEDLMRVVESFEYFIRGIGYHPRGNVVIYDEQTDDFQS